MGRLGNRLLFAGSPHVVGYKEPSAIQVFTQFGSHVPGQVDPCGAPSVQEWPVKDVVPILKIDGLFNRPPVDSGKPVERGHEVTIPSRIIIGPTWVSAAPLPPVRAEKTAEAPA